MTPPGLVGQSVVIHRHHPIVRGYFARSAGSIIDCIKKKYNCAVDYVKKKLPSSKKKTAAAANTSVTQASVKKMDGMALPPSSVGGQQSGAKTLFQVNGATVTVEHPSYLLEVMPNSGIYIAKL